MRRILLSIFTWIALGGLMLTTACSGANTVKEKPTPTPLPTAAAANKPTYKVTRGDVTAQVKFSARVIPAVEEELYFRADGRVRKVYIRSGDQVKKGQVLADLISLDQMESQAKQQQFNQRKAEINLEMAWLNQQLAATQDSTWNAGYDIRAKEKQLQVELAQIELDETKLQTKNLDTAISDAQITSPMDGKVLEISVLEGAEVRAFAPLVTVGDDSKLEVGATLTSTQMQELAEGMVSSIELPNRPGQKLQGKIRSLPYPYGTGGGTKTSTTVNSTTGQSTDNTTRVALDNPDSIKGFRLGDLVDVTVVLESRKAVLWVAPQAIRTYEGRNFVVVKTDALPKRVDVRIGIKNEEQVEILEGVEEGQVIIAP